LNAFFKLVDDSMGQFLRRSQHLEAIRPTADGYEAPFGLRAGSGRGHVQDAPLDLFRVTQDIPALHKDPSEVLSGLHLPAGRAATQGRNRMRTGSGGCGS
jgi:hypothetical protein